MLKGAVLVGFLLLFVPSIGHAGTSHTLIVNMAGCRTVFNGATPPFSDYIQYDTFNKLYDWITQDVSNNGTSNVNSNLICDFRLPDNTVSLDSVDMYYNQANATNVFQPALHVVVAS